MINLPPRWEANTLTVKSSRWNESEAGNVMFRDATSVVQLSLYVQYKYFFSFLYCNIYCIGIDWSIAA